MSSGVQVFRDHRNDSGPSGFPLQAGTEATPRSRKSVTFHTEDLLNIYRAGSVDSFSSCQFSSPPQLDMTRQQVAQPMSSSLTSILEEESSIERSPAQFARPGRPVSDLLSGGNLRVDSSMAGMQSQGREVETPVHSRSCLAADTASRLSSFSQRLRSLTRESLVTPRTPATPLTPRMAVTPRSAASTATPDSRAGTPRPGFSACPDPQCCVALLEGRGQAAGEVGIAAFTLDNLGLGLTLCQFSDTTTYPRTITKLLSINPATLITPDHEPGVKLYEDIAARLPLANVVSVKRKYFNECQGLRILKLLIIPELASVEMQFHNKFYCLAAANALIKYVENVENFMFVRRALKIEYQVAEKSTIIDPSTAADIELMSSMGDKKSKLSLFGVLNRCSTKGGVKYLRSNLFQPPIDEKLIEARLEVVTELMDDAPLHHNMKNLVSKFPDLGSVLNLCIQRPQGKATEAQNAAKIDRMTNLKLILELLSPLHELLNSSKSPLLQEGAKMLSSYVSTSTLLLEMMHLVLEEKAAITRRPSSSVTSFNRVFAVKQDVNGLLDIARQTFAEMFDNLHNYVGQLAEQHELPLKLEWQTNKGFFILLLTGKKNAQVDENNLPGEFQRIHKLRNGISFVTQEFSVKETMLKTSLLEITIMSNSVLDELLIEVRDYIGFLYKLSDLISSLDMFLSLAAVSQSDGFVRPEFGDCLAIKAGRHPILDTMTASDCIGNDTMADSLSRLHVLTGQFFCLPADVQFLLLGPNMSGKSTYLRQVVLLSIMAQLGCYVPAERATFRIPDRIFSRVNNRDCLETNASTFMLEMQETAFILANVSSSSLVIIDELGRGTSLKEGASICWAVCEKLLPSKAFVFLATHFKLMTEMADLHPCVENYQFLTETLEDGRIR